MKRIIGITAAAVMTFTSSIFAAYGNVGGYMDGDNLTIEHSGSDAAVVAVYDDNGRLVYADHAKYDDGKYNLSLPDGMADKKIRLIAGEEETYDVTIGEPDPTEAPTEEAEQATPFPAMYEKEGNAIHAPALIRKVTKTVDEEGELIYRLSMYYQGAETEADVKETVTIASAPAQQSYVVGETAAALKEGDVIHFVCNLSHKIKSINLIYRSDFTKYVQTGTDTANALGSDGTNTYAFGIPVKTEKGYISLSSGNGIIKDIDVAAGAFVYGVKNVSKGYMTDFLGIGSASVPKVAVPHDHFDDDGTIITWTGIDIDYYVLARLVDGAATDIVVIEY